MTSQTGGFFVVLTRLRSVMQNFGEARKEVINMAPEIWIGKNLIASVLDKTGMHKTVNGKPLYVNVDRINADWDRQKIILEADEIGGRREIGLTKKGKGVSSDRKLGDGKLPEIVVRLDSRPIRDSYRDNYVLVVREESLGDAGYKGYYNTSRKRTYRNPYWIKNRG